MIIVCPNCESKFKVPDGALGSNGRTLKCSKCNHKWPQYPLDDSPEEPSLTTENGDSNATKTTDHAKTEERSIEKDENLQNQKSEDVETESPATEAMESEESSETPPKPKKPRRYQAEKTPLYQNNFVYYGAWVATASCIIIFLTMVLAFKHDTVTRIVPVAQKVYDLVGIFDTSGLKLELVDCTLNEIKSSSSDNESIEIEVEVSVANTSNAAKKLSSIRFTIYDIQRNYVGELKIDLKRLIAPGESTTVEGRLNRVPRDSFYVAVDFGNKMDLKLIKPNRTHKIG